MVRGLLFKALNFYLNVYIIQSSKSLLYKHPFLMSAKRRMCVRQGFACLCTDFKNKMPWPALRPLGHVLQEQRPAIGALPQYKMRLAFSKAIYDHVRSYCFVSLHFVIESPDVAIYFKRTGRPIVGDLQCLAARWFFKFTNSPGSALTVSIDEHNHGRPDTNPRRPKYSVKPAVCATQNNRHLT